MKEIKFRSHDGADWVYSNCVDYDKETDTYYVPNNTLDDWTMVGKVSRYSGLKDKNGKEIYLDSDIVKLVVLEGGVEPYVEYFDGNFIVHDPEEPTKHEHEGIITEGEFGDYKIGDFYLLNLEAADHYAFEIIGSNYNLDAL